MMKTKEKMTKKLAFTWSWENAKDLNICNFYFRIKKKKKKEMNHVNRNRINNYFYMYDIKNAEENFKRLFWKWLKKENL